MPMSPPSVRGGKRPEGRGMKIFEFACPVRREPTPDELFAAAARNCGVPRGKVLRCDIIKRSLDARGELLYRYQVRALVEGDAPVKDYRFDYKNVSSAEPVLIVGGGPAGMFAALRLLELGLKPVIIERGKDVHARKRDIAAISTQGIVNPDSNYCYGEGGAGTFSDGKLFTRSSKRGDIYEVLHQMVAFGAQKQILIDAHPHIGSDVLPAMVERLRECITAHGGEYHFGCRVTGLRMRGGDAPRWEALCEGGETFSADNVILATGHSARDIYRMFDTNGWQIEQKDFALGVRVEHPQSLVNFSRYHGRWQQGMPPAEYSLAEQIEGRGVFSFCMCPGGILVPSSTEGEAVVLNGMSNSLRNGPRANAGIVVQVSPSDVPEYAKYGTFSLMRFQEDLERAMYAFSGSLRAPAQRMVDFCKGRPSVNLPASSYTAGVSNAQLRELLPPFVAESLRRAFPLFDRKMKGFYTNDALVLACESRTSSPIRIPRDPESLQHPQLPGLFPCGEGAGYAGGIVSSALDGIACANAIG